MRREAVAAGRGATLAVEDACDDVVGIVDGEPTQPVDGGAGGRTAVPADGQDGGGTWPVDGEDALLDQGPEQRLAIAHGRGGAVPDAMEVAGEGLEGGAADRLSLAPLPLAAGELGLGLMERDERPLPLGLEAAGDEAILRVDGAVATFGLSCRVAPTLDVTTPLTERGVITGLEPFRRSYGGGDSGRRDGGEDGLDDGVVDLNTADVQAVDTPAIDDVFAGAVVARRRSRAAIMGA